MKDFFGRIKADSDNEDSAKGLDGEESIIKQMALPINAMIGNRYMIEECILADGFECVYQAMDLLLKKTVYLHEYFPSDIADRRLNVSFRITEQDGEAYKLGLELYTKRAERLVAYNDLEHFEHIVSHFDDNNTYYMIGEAVDAVSLDAVLSGISYEEGAGIVSQTVDVLNRLHSHSFIQCDVTPKHIMLGEQGVLLLAGGQEKYEFRKKTSSSQISSFSGYGAPELFQDEAVEEKTDVYAIAALYYHILSGIILVDILDKRYQVIKDIRKANQMKEATKADFEAINRGLGILGNDRATDFEDFQHLLSFKVPTARFLKKNLEGVPELKEIKQSSVEKDRKKVLIPLAAVATVIVLLCLNLGIIPRYGQAPHPQASKAPMVSVDKELVSATPGNTPVGATVVPSATTTGTPLPLATTVSDKKGSKKAKTPKPKASKKIKETSAARKGRDSTTVPQTEKRTSAPKAPKEVISGNDGEETIRGLR